MKWALAGAVLSALASAVPANARCRAWTNVMAIASNTGAACIMGATLSNDAEFIFRAGGENTVAAFYVGEDGSGFLYGWSEDSNGTAVLTDDYGHTCTLGCNGTVGVTMTIAGSGFTTLSWNIAASGLESMPGDVCGCSRGATYNKQNVPCTTANCNAGVKCRPGSTGNPAGCCQAGSSP